MNSKRESSDSSANTIQSSSTIAARRPATAIAGVLTVIPAFEAIEMVFGLGSIVWFTGVGIELIRTSDQNEATS